jgi:hypothetical protein
MAGGVLIGDNIFDRYLTKMGQDLFENVQSKSYGYTIWRNPYRNIENDPRSIADFIGICNLNGKEYKYLYNVKTSIDGTDRMSSADRVILLNYARDNGYIPTEIVVNLTARMYSVHKIQ